MCGSNTILPENNYTPELLTVNNGPIVPIMPIPIMHNIYNIYKKINNNIKNNNIKNNDFKNNDFKNYYINMNNYIIKI